MNWIMKFLNLAVKSPLIGLLPPENLVTMCPRAGHKLSLEYFAMNAAKGKREGEFSTTNIFLSKHKEVLFLF
jgi:hypothetical protein